MQPPSLPSNIPDRLEAICRRCLEKDPARRYATAGELADDLDRFRQEPQPAAAESWWRKLFRRGGPA